MNHLIEIIGLLWPSLLVTGLFTVFLLIAGRLDMGRPVVIVGSVVAIGVLGMFFVIPAMKKPIRWGLTLFGFAAPMALGVISIRYIVEET